MYTIVLTKEFFRLRKIQYKDAVADLITGRAKPVHQYTVFPSLDDWFLYARGVDELSTRIIRTVDTLFYVPEFMIFLNSSIPIKKHPPRSSRKNIWLRDNKKCAYCGKLLVYEQSTVDHVIPTCRGGKDKWNNVVISCKKCNNLKGDKYLEDCGLSLRVTPKEPSWMELLAKRSEFGFV